MSEDVPPYGPIPTPQPEGSANFIATVARAHLEKLARLSAAASEDWASRQRLGGGSVCGGPNLDLAGGHRKTQIASFSVPRLPDNDPRDPAAIQAANADFAVACVGFVRGLIAELDAADGPSGASPAPDAITTTP